MEQFKAVEKEMKTKAFSKEGLLASAKLDPKEKAKQEAVDFLASMVDELERQIESLEAEEEALTTNVKKNKKDSAKQDRLSEVRHILESHRWHQGKLELLQRAVENGNVDTDQIESSKEGIKYYVEENQSVDFMEDDTVYDEFNLDEEEGHYGLGADNDRVSSQDAQSIQDDTVEADTGPEVKKTKSSSASGPSGTAARRPSTQLKSPLPALATLHTVPPPVTIPKSKDDMKPAPVPTRPPGETLRYASAAAAAAQADKGVGIAPLPPPPGAAPPPAATNTGLAPLPPSSKQASTTTSPSVTAAQPAASAKPPLSTTASTENSATSGVQIKSPALSHSSVAAGSSLPSTSAPTPAVEKAQNVSTAKAPEAEPEQAVTQPPLDFHSDNHAGGEAIEEPIQDYSIFHLPPGLQDLIESFENTKSSIQTIPSPAVQRLLAASHNNCPEPIDAEKPKNHKAQSKYPTPSHYPQTALSIFDDPRLYDTGRIDTDTLFYIFYYQQGSYQQYLAAKSLKSQSWRFHKQYQTWFQRHEEPKTITDEFEQGTYRFFDYESTWLVHQSKSDTLRKKLESGL